MQPTSEPDGPPKARVLLFSQRNIYRAHYRCSVYEFEDIIRNVDSVHCVAPEPSGWFQYGTRLANALAAHSAFELNPGLPITKVGDYDLFFVICQFPKDLCNIRALHGWRDRCKISICWLNEVWLADLHGAKSWIDSLKNFDYVVVSCSQTLSALTQSLGDKCHYLPHGIDTILFCPYPHRPKRSIDLYSIGRRSESTHHAILKLAKDSGVFYVYDSMDGEQVINPYEHRSLFANMAKRSKYFIVNPGKIDSPAETKQQIEFGTRYFEGAASGTIMIGERPDNKEFEKCFDWSDVVIDMQFGSEQVAPLLRELDKDPERQAQTRKANVVQSLRRHDWVYRWEAVLKIAGLDPLAALHERKRRLQNLASVAEDARDGG